MAGIIPYETGDIVEMKKEHPCHKSKEWKIIRMGWINYLIKVN